MTAEALIIIPCGIMMPWGINFRFRKLSPCQRQVAYALLTRAPVVSSPKTLLPLDLHVLSLPLAFILSQDQTLRCTLFLQSLVDRHPLAQYAVIPLTFFLSQYFQ